MRHLNGFTLENISYMNTSRGVAYSADLMFGGKRVGIIENHGNGGVTTISFPDSKTRETSMSLIVEYFEDMGQSTKGVAPYSLQYTFAEQLMNYTELGSIDSDIGFLG